MVFRVTWVSEVNHEFLKGAQFVPRTADKAALPYFVIFVEIVFLEARLSLCLTKHHVFKTNGGQLHAFSSSTIDGGE
jgi:hypothetical protein